MTVELPDKYEAVLKTQANAHGMSPTAYVCALLERDSDTGAEHPRKPFKSGRGMLAKYGPAPSAEEIDANRADMFRNFGENF